jgi:uncharacterized protein YkwD
MKPAVLGALAFLVMDARAANVEPPWSWAGATTSPTTLGAETMNALELALQSRCGIAEGGLRTVARRLIERKIRELPYLDLDGLTFAQRVAGEPHVWPRAWIVSAKTLEQEATSRKMAEWRQSFRDIGERRCGVATGRAADGTQIAAAIALDALGDLAPIPVKSHAGTWLTVDARLLVPARGAQVIVVGPDGSPRTVPTSFEGGRVRARFAPDRPGAFTVQVMADVQNGPRPILEAQLFADVEPPAATPVLAAPGESAADGVNDSAQAMLRMVQALRADARLSPLKRDARLDALALAHAKRMMQAHTVGHDMGDGDPAQRLQNAGLVATETGENVAHAQNAKLAHRSLYASPSHRQNLLRADFDRFGLAVLDDPGGAYAGVWVVEFFARGLK